MRFYITLAIVLLYCGAVFFAALFFRAAFADVFWSIAK